MAEPSLSSGDLRHESAVADEVIDAAVRAYLKDPLTGDFPNGAYTFVLAAAVLASWFAIDMLARAGVIDPSKRNAVHTPFLLAGPSPRAG